MDANSTHGTNALLERVGEGDHAAFAELYDRIASLVYGEARRVLRDPAHAEEVAQEVLVEAWRTAPRYDQTKGCAVTWVLTIARRRAVDRVRAEQAFRDRSQRWAARDDNRCLDEVAEAVEEHDAAAEVRTALQRCSGLQRQAIELRYYRGCTYREVAQRLDLPVGTVKTRVRDGIACLRATLAARGMSPAGPGCSDTGSGRVESVSDQRGGPRMAFSSSLANTCNPNRSDISSHTRTPRTLLP